ncbi:hypothetical protein [Trichothermofontia sp.]
MLLFKSSWLKLLVLASLATQITGCFFVPFEGSSTSPSPTPTNSPAPTPSPSLGSINSVGQAPRPAEVSRYETQVKTKLDAIKLLAGLGDYEQTHDNYVNLMEGGMTENLKISLESGINYAIIGVCDEDCTDLDFILYDDNGNKIGTDREVDNFPVVTANPRWSATFTLTVDMYRCNNAPCYFGVGVFAERKPSKLISQ